MQTIYIDISNKGVMPTIYAKQGDVGRKFKIIFTNAGLPFMVEKDWFFSAWYSGASGDGNYTDVGEKSAFSVSKNSVEVEMITQMLLHEGEGVFCVVLNSANGSQIGSWNIPYKCESVPGIYSEGAKQYYTAFSNAVASIKIPDETLTIKGRSADAEATGKALKTKAPSGFGSGEDPKVLASFSALETLRVSGKYFVNAGTAGSITIDGYNIGYAQVDIIGKSDSVVIQRMNPYRTGYWLQRTVSYDGTVSPWEWENPPMISNKEYRTTERWGEKVVYTVLLSMGKFATGGIALTTEFSTTGVIRYAGQGNGFALPNIFGTIDDQYTIIPIVYMNNGKIKVIVNGGSRAVGSSIYVTAWYTKD